MRSKTLITLTAAVILAVPVITFAAKANRAPVIQLFEGGAVAATKVSQVWKVLAVDVNKDAYDITIDWGDGSAPEKQSQEEITATAKEFSFPHTYLKMGNYEIVIRADDRKKGKTETTMTVMVGDQMVDLSLDPKSPVASQVAPGQKMTMFTVLRFGTVPQNYKAMIKSIRVVSDSPAAASIENIRLLRCIGCTPALININPKATWDGVQPNGVRYAEIGANGGQHLHSLSPQEITIAADVSDTAQGNIRLGISGITFETSADYGKPVVSAPMPLYGRPMTAKQDKTPRIAHHPGYGAEAINKYIDTATGQWKNDPDNADTKVTKLESCKKYFPKTTSVQPYKTENVSEWLSNFFRPPANQGYIMLGVVTTDRCVQSSAPATNTTESKSVTSAEAALPASLYVTIQNQLNQIAARLEELFVE